MFYVFSLHSILHYLSGSTSFMIFFALHHYRVLLCTRLEIGSSVRMSVIPSSLQTKCNILNFMGDTQFWTLCSFKDCSHFTDITRPWGGTGSKCRTYRLCHILTLLPPGDPCFTSIIMCSLCNICPTMRL